MSAVRSFPPIADPSARTLILGSMPGVQSLAANRYYAHPRNAFWPIMAALIGFDLDASYERRAQALMQSGFALWDVLEACVRPGSLDSAIETGSRVANDFQTFFAKHPALERVCFNGAEAERSFRVFALPGLGIPALHFVRLPSTSPAYTLPFQQKLAAWRAGLIDPC